MLSGSRSPALPFWKEKGHLYLWESGPSRRCRWREGLEGGRDSGAPRRGRYSAPAGQPPDTRETRPERGWDLAGVPGLLRTLSGLSLLCAHPSPHRTGRETLPRQLWPCVVDQRAPVLQGPLSLPRCAPDSPSSPLNYLLKGASSPPPHAFYLPWPLPPATTLHLLALSSAVLSLENHSASHHPPALNMTTPLLEPPRDQPPYANPPSYPR